MRRLKLWIGLILACAGALTGLSLLSFIDLNWQAATYLLILSVVLSYVAIDLWMFVEQFNPRLKRMLTPKEPQ